MLDLVIVGAGPTGINCAIEACKAGLNYEVVEKGLLVNSIFHFPSNMTFFSTSEKLEIGDTPFISHTDKPTRREALEYYRRLMEAYALQISFREQVMAASKQADGTFLLKTDKRSIATKAIAVATGFYDIPNKLNVPGEDLPKVKHYYDEVHHYIKQNVLVIGGANSACDVALECWQKGAHVTMAVRQPQLYQKVKYWILPNIENRIKEGSIKAYFSTTVTSIQEDSVTLATPDGAVVIPNDYVLAMTGYSPDYGLLQRLGVDIQSDDKQTPVCDPATLETSTVGIYLAGVVLGGLKTNAYFIENTRHHGKVIVEQLQAQLG